jgi:DNA segregation ATPase FtsK/SpoIIIE-like protein
MLEKIQKYLKETGNVFVEAVSIKEGILHSEVTLKVKAFEYISKVEKSLDGLPYFVQCPSPIIMPNPENGCFKLIIPHKDIKNIKFDSSHLIRPTQIFLGMDESGDRLMLDLSKTTHTIIAGATGSGKSMVIHSIIHSLLQFDAVDIVFLDPKKVESQMYTGAKGQMSIASTPADISGQLSRIHKWMESRYSYMAKLNIRDAMDRWVTSSFSDTNLRPMVLIVDEVADLFSENKAAKSELLVLSSKARAAGLRIFLATQRPDAKIIDGAIKANFTTRICLKTSSKIDSMIVLGFTGAENLRGNGHGLLLLSSGSLIPFKGAYIDNIRLARYTSDKTIEEPISSLSDMIVTNDIKRLVNGYGALVKRE